MPKTCKWRGGLRLTEKCPLPTADWDWVQFRLKYNNKPAPRHAAAPEKEKTQKLNLLCDTTCACCSVTPNKRDSVWKCGCQAAGKTVRKPGKVRSAQFRKKVAWLSIQKVYCNHWSHIPAWQLWTGLHFPWYPPLFGHLLRLKFWRSTSSFDEVFGIATRTSLP